MNARLIRAMLVAALTSSLVGCAIGGHSGISPPPEITAVSLNPQDAAKFGTEVGIPFYLPKPLLIVSKNFRNIEETKTGVTDTVPIPTGFDDQAKFADVNARTNFTGLQSPVDSSTDTTTGGSTKPAGSTAEKSGAYLHSSGVPVTPGVAPADGLSPSTFYTYHIVFVPDLSQKYGLRIRGGPGEIRAAMNIVNGWQFTGIGPFYMKDSATAQNILASGISSRLLGQGAADVLNAAADLAKSAGGLTRGDVLDSDSTVIRQVQKFNDLRKEKPFQTIANFAEIHVYEPVLCPDGRTEWSQILKLNFDREYVGTEEKDTQRLPLVPIPNARADAGRSAADNTTSGEVSKAALNAVFGPNWADGRRVGTGPLTAGAVDEAVMPATVNQSGFCNKSGEFNFFKIGNLCPPRPTIARKAVVLPSDGDGADHGLTKADKKVSAKDLTKQHKKETGEPPAASGTTPPMEEHVLPMTVLPPVPILPLPSK